MRAWRETNTKGPIDETTVFLYVCFLLGPTSSSYDSFNRFILPFFLPLTSDAYRSLMSTNGL